MANTALQSAKREMQSLATNRGVWIALVAVGIILGLAGPFGTEQVMRAVPRVIYWLFVAVGSFFVGSTVATGTGEGLRALGVNRWVAVVLAGIAAGAVNFALLVAVNVAIFGVHAVEPDPMRVLGINVILISIIIAGAYVMIDRHLERSAPPEAVREEPPRILARLPVDKRGALISISVQDHYVDVATTSGREMILLRLSDAIAETGPAQGLRVHRSHWVATAQVTAARRDGARVILTMSDGRDIPVSRTYVPAVKEAGLLP